MATFGRRVITTDEAEITANNVVAVLQQAMTTHIQNQSEIQYLYDYFRGIQPVLDKSKDVRPEINNKVIENTAYEIVEFKTGYFTYEAIQYVSTREDKAVTDQVELLNRYMMVQDKAAQDVALAWWFHICGLAYRMILPNESKEPDDGDVPFEIYTLDPRYTFVVRHNGLGNKPVMNVKYVNKADGTVVYSVYTKDYYFEIDNCNSLRLIQENPIGQPIIEYPANLARLGSFEIVQTLMDAINQIESDRTDAIDQFVQALLLFHNVVIDDKDYEKLREQGAISFKDVDPTMKAEIKYLVEQLDQHQTQTAVDHLYQRILTICGMPNRNGGSSTSDTGKAVIYRDGWGAAEYRAKLTESCFRSAEKEFLRMVLKICRELDDIDLTLMDFEVRMPRRNYDNVKEKADTLVMMLGSKKIAPKLAFEHCGLFVDPEVAYQSSMIYAEEQEKKDLAALNGLAGVDPADGDGDGVINE